MGFAGNRSGGRGILASEPAGLGVRGSASAMSEAEPSIPVGGSACSLASWAGRREWSWAEKVYRQVHEREALRGKERLRAEARTQPG